MSPATAGSEGETGEIIFRVTLEGPVPPAHAFAIECGPSRFGENLCFSVEDIIPVCDTNPFYDFPVCEAKTYEVVTTAVPGQVIEYALLRLTSSDPTRPAHPERHLPGTWTVHEGRQVISLTYVYPGGAPAPVLPDTRATGGETGEVVFRVTLEGPVPPTHTFGIRCDIVEGYCFGEVIELVCTPPSDSPFDDSLEPCAPGTYEVVMGSRPVGSTIDYALLRWTSTDLAHTDDQPEEHIPGSWTVREGRQVISLGYVYPGTAPSPVLPDTAIAAP